MHSIFSRSILITLVSLLAITPTMQAVSAEDSTPAADEPAVHFSLHAIGDYENNYFDDVEVEPNGTVELEVMVVNWLAEPVDLKLYPANGLNAVNGGFRAGEQGEDLVGSASWMDLSTTEIALNAEEHRVVAFAINVPEGTEPGQYISAIVAEIADPLAIPGQSAINHRVRYSLSVGILVPGDLNPSFELGAPVITGTNLDVPISNNGNVLVKPAGAIELLDANGAVILSSGLELGSVYAGNETTISLGLAAPLPEGEYTLNLSLKDVDSDARASLDAVPVEYVVLEVAAESTVTLLSAVITPNSEEIVYADVEISLQNDGEQVPVDVVLHVYKDGELLEDASLATNQVFVAGENTFSMRYLPADSWAPGTYTFGLTVIGVDPQSDHEQTLFSISLEAEFSVP